MGTLMLVLIIYLVKRMGVYKEDIKTSVRVEGVEPESVGD